MVRQRRTHWRRKREQTRRSSRNLCDLAPANGWTYHAIAAAKLGQLARELDTWARYLRLTGLDDGVLVAAMSDRTADIRTLLNAAGSAELKKEGKCREEMLHRQVKYLNNIIEADHGKLKQLIRPVRGFTTLKTAYATIKGFEVMRALRKGRASAFNITLTFEARPASSSARLASVPRLWLRPSSLSANGSSSWRRNRPPDPIGRFARPQPENCNRAPRIACWLLVIE